MNNTDTQSKFVVWLAGVGIMVVILIGLVSLATDRGGIVEIDSGETSEDESSDGGQEVDPYEGWENFESADYGISFKYQDQEIVENPRNVDLSLEVIDCRKMSSSLRESLLTEGICYEVLVQINENQYIVISTGDGLFQGTNEDSIEPSDSSETELYPKSKINLPLERVRISSFPTNLQGTEVVYENGKTYTYFKGIVYKGADKYAITIQGEFDEEIQELIQTFELE